MKAILSNYPVDEVVITGLNAEYCCLFSAIIASDRGYKVTYIEDATAASMTATLMKCQDLDRGLRWLRLGLVGASRGSILR